LLDNGKEEKRQSFLVASSRTHKTKQPSTESDDALAELLGALELGKLRDRAQKRGRGLQGRGGPSSGDEILGDKDDLEYNINLNFEKCDWAGAINYQPRCHGTFGYLLSWSGCDGIDLKQDITVVNPYSTANPKQTMPVQPDPDQGSTFKCVGVIEKFKYEGEANDPIFIKAYVSKANAASLHGAFERVQPSTHVDVAWYIIASEGAGEGWYEAAFIGGFAKAAGNIDSAPLKKEARAGSTNSKDIGGNLRIKIDHESTALGCSDPSEEGEVDIRLYRFAFQMIPAPGTTTNLHFATSSGAKRVLTWKGKSP
jgi:hypothetical protein